MTLRVSELQLDSDLDSIRNSCDVFSHHFHLLVIWYQPNLSTIGCRVPLLLPVGNQIVAQVRQFLLWAPHNWAICHRDLRFVICHCDL